MDKPAPADHPVHDLIGGRWSPYAFSSEAVAREQVLSVLEAARWAASSYNAQPWSFLVGLKGDETWQGVYDCLVDANRAWASEVPVLMLSMAHETFPWNGKPNRHAQYDTGQAVAALALQATDLGLFVHQMAGFDAEAARTRFAIPPGHTLMAAIALGSAGDPDTLSVPPAARERAPRERGAVSTFTFAGQWGEEARLA